MTRLGRVLVATPLMGLLVANLAGTDWRVFWPGRPSAAARFTLPEQPIELVGQLRGGDSGRLAVIEFADFQCPFSRAFAREVQPQLFEDYVETGRVVWSFRHLPLTAIHPEARLAAELSECAAPQAGFWPVHDVLFSVWRGTPLRSLDIRGLLGLDASSMQSCLQRASPAVDRDRRAAAALGVTVTPTFLIGPIRDGYVTVEEVVVGHASIERYRAAIDRGLARLRPAVPSSGSAAP